MFGQLDKGRRYFAASFIVIFFIVSVALLSGCGATVVKEESLNKSYMLGQKASTNIDELMAFKEHGVVEKKKRWVGILNSPDGYEVISRKYSPDFLRQELIYKGKSGESIKIEYRELHAGSLMPESQDTMTFDLASSDAIVIKNFQLQILQASEKSISYIVNKD